MDLAKIKINAMGLAQRVRQAFTRARMESRHKKGGKEEHPMLLLSMTESELIDEQGSLHKDYEPWARGCQAVIMAVTELRLQQIKNLVGC